ncbi:sugar-binding domain-containing protein [Sphingobacterium sp. SGR-19]|uniref:exo-beta-1,4-galactosidase n=1 Tax=Sphingobacterium sp. SGR-19 TaxID=2710886 RepID=UPI0013E9A5A2|nr:sugar-binding domain-containing protein [Sphingobacterium sp. SGR-19]NGM64584.1 beta-glucuronidase [Sphingobacterium sp. SGR-19]
MNRFIFVCILALFVSEVWAQRNFIDLSGSWRFALDRDDVGTEQFWFDRVLQEEVRLPGSLVEQNIGDVITLETQWTGSIYDSSFYYHPRLEKFRQSDNLKLPFWLTPLKHYVGVAWYQRDFVLSANDLRGSLNLFLEQPHTEASVWVNGKEVGTQNSMVVAHQFEIADLVKEGNNTLTIRVDNRIKTINVGPDSHSLTDHTQGNWNGIIGRIGMEKRSKIHLDDIQVYPDIHQKKANIRLNVRTNRTSELRILYKAESFNSSVFHQTRRYTRTIQPRNVKDTIDLSMTLGEGMLLWDEFHPNVYRATFQLYDGENLLDEREVTFGMREFKARGRYFYVNGRKTFLRGTCDNAVFPITGYPDTDVDSWLKIFRKIKSYGLNHVRYHSWCPPEAAFKAADIVGLYLQPEGPSWANHGSSLGRGEPIDQYIYEETGRMARQYGNYASFCMMAYGNEPRGNQIPYLTAFVNYWKAKDARRLYTGASVGGSWPVIQNNEFMVRAGARGVDWNRRPESQSDFRQQIAQFTVPFVAHELGQHCVFPNFEEIEKYTGAYRAKNFELFEEDLNDHHMGDQAKIFLQASGGLQALAYKHEMERAFRTPGYSGFQLLSLSDYPGQGTAMVGLLDAFWEEKGYIDAKEFRKACDTTVLLIRTPKFVFDHSETLRFSIDVVHFGQRALENPTLNWRLLNNKRNAYAEGKLIVDKLDLGLHENIEQIEVPLDGIRTAKEMKLEIVLEGTEISNDWDFYIYPKELPVLSNDVFYATEINDRVSQALAGGGTVFLNLSGKITKGKEIEQHFRPVFWNTSWFKMRPPHTLGITLDDRHAAFASFPTKNHSSLQWWDVLHKTQVMHLEDFPASFRPLVQPIDTWFMNRRLALLFEAKVGKGKILVSSADLSEDSENIVRKNLYHSIVNYMASSSFQPAQEIDIRLIQNLVTKESTLTFDTYTRSSPDELKPDLKEMLQH